LRPQGSAKELLEERPIPVSGLVGQGVHGYGSHPFTDDLMGVSFKCLGRWRTIGCRPNSSDETPFRR
jgi:hypothetical protein